MQNRARIYSQEGFVNREYHKWYSQRLGRDMELLVHGHHGARVIVFPTSMGRYYDWENRKMMEVLGEHIEKGWLQVFSVDSVDTESWYNKGAHPHDRAVRHLIYQDYIVNEVIPFINSKNNNPFTIATGASFGGYHALSIGMRFPRSFNRILSMSGFSDIRQFTDGYSDSDVHYSNPLEIVRHLSDHDELEAIRRLDIIIAIGEHDPNIGDNRAFDHALWDKNIWHATRIWDGWSHDWPYWEQMILHYIGGPDSKSLAS